MVGTWGLEPQTSTVSTLPRQVTDWHSRHRWPPEAPEGIARHNYRTLIEPSFPYFWTARGSEALFSTLPGKGKRIMAPLKRCVAQFWPSTHY